MMLRPLLLCIGWLALFAGLLGLVLPLLPTTPFVLLAAGCFSRSSARCHRWLASTPLLGGILADYASNRVISSRNRRLALSLLWIGIGSSCVLLWRSVPLTLLLLSIAVAVTAVLFSLPTALPRRFSTPPQLPAAKRHTCMRAIEPADGRPPRADGLRGRDHA